MSFREEHERLRNRIESIQAELGREVNASLVTTLGPVFEKYPSLTRVSWTAYTPYFNDGENCEYGSNHSYASVTVSEGAVELPEDERDYDDDEDDNAPEEIREAVQEVLNGYSDDEMLAGFGDHVEITVSRTDTGIEIESSEYDHE